MYRTLIACLTLVIAVGSAIAQDMIPNSSFEEGQNGTPAGWKCEGPGTGAWETGGHTGKHCVSVVGSGKEDSTLWRCDGVPMQPGQTYRFSFWSKSEGAGGGCIVSGPSFANRDMGVGDKWERQEFVFVAPPNAAGAYLRIGVWAMKGKVLFDDIALEPVTAVNATFGRLSLADGEELSADTYSFEPNFGYEGSNYSTNLVGYTCGFNSNRWPFSPGTQLTYRQGLPGVAQTSGKVTVNLGYFSQGSCVVEASRDGNAWERVGVLSKIGGATFDLPATLFPADQVFVRMVSPGATEARADSAPGSFQIDHYRYEAKLAQAAEPLKGSTSFLDILRAASGAEVKVLSLGDRRPGGVNVARLNLRNTQAAPLIVSAIAVVQTAGEGAVPLSKGKPVTIPGGQTTEIALPYEVVSAGDYVLTLKLSAATVPLFVATAKFTVSSLYDADYGYLIAKVENNFGPDVWWCESSYKVSRERPRPKRMAVGPITMSAARNETQAVQVVLRDTHSAQMSAYMDGDEDIPDKCWAISRVAYHYVKTPSDYTGCVGWWPDALPKLGGYNMPANQILPLWISVHVPEGAKPGIHKVKLTIEADSWGIKLPIEVRVRDFTLPKEPSIESGFGLSEGTIAQYHNLTNIADRRKVWDLYMQNFRDHRMCTYDFAPFDPLKVSFTGIVWTGGEYSTEAAASGKQSLKIADNSTTAAIQASYNKQFAVQPGGRYRLAWKCKTAAPQQHYLVTMGQFKADGSWLSGNNIDIERIGDGDWKDEEFIIEPGRLNPLTASLGLTLRPAVWTEKGEATGTAWFDDVFFGEAGGANVVEDPGFETAPGDIKAVADFTEWDKQAEKYLDGYKFTNFVVPIMTLGGMSFNADGSGAIGPYKQGTEGYIRLYKDAAMLVQNHLEQKGWLHKAYVYFVDEPPPTQYEYCRQYNQLIHENAPKVRRMLTIQPTKELEGSVDVWCLIEPNLNFADTQARQKAGDTIWWYVCTGPKAPWPGLFIDHSAIDLRMWLWMTWKYHIQGVLIWTTNWWTSGAAFPKEPQNPWEDPMGYVDGGGLQPGQIATWGNGDGRMLYPPNQDVNHNKEPFLEGPVNSIRWEMLCAGIQDYEYFKLLENGIAQAKRAGKSPALIAQAEKLLVVPESITTDLTHFTKDPQLLLARRNQIAEMIEKLGGK